MSRFRHFIFDLDGTLVDSRPGITTAICAAINYVAPELAVAGLHVQIGPPIPEVLARALPTAGLESLNQVRNRFRTIYDSTGWQNTAPYPFVQGTLASLRATGNTCFLVTNKPSVPTLKILDYLGLHEYFRAIVCPDSQEPAFANKEQALRHLLLRYNIPRRESVYIGDDEADARASAACGVGFIYAAYGYGGVFQGQAFDNHLTTIRSIEEILMLG